MREGKYKKTGLRLKWAWLAKNRPEGEKVRKGKKWGEMMDRTGAQTKGVK